MSLYELQVRVAFDGSWAAAGTWTDITPYVRIADGVSWSRGSAVDEQGLQPGTAEFALNNDDGRFTPDRTKLRDGVASNPYGTVRLRLPVQIRVRYPRGTGTWYEQWRGWIDDWGSAGTNGVRGIARVTCSDVVNRLPGKPANLRSALTEHIAAQSPVWFWPMTDPENSLFAAEYGGGAPLRPVRRTTTPPALGALDFGVGSVGPDQDTQVAFTPASTSDYVVLAAEPGGGSTAWSMTAVVTRTEGVTNPFWGNELFRFDPAVPVVGLYPISIGVDSDGYLYVADSSGASYTSWLMVPNDGQPHLVGYSNNLATKLLWLDGQSYEVSFGGISFSGGRPMVVGESWSGRISHLAFFPSAGAPAEVWAAFSAGRSTRSWLQSVLGWAKYGITLGGTGDGDTYTAPLVAGRSATDVIGDLIASERGRLYAARAGGLAFEPRSSRYSQSVAWSVPASALDPDTDFPFDLSELANDIRVGTRGLDITWSDQPSVDAYGPAPLGISAPLVSEDQGREIASWVGNARSTPRPRCDDLTIDLVTKAASIPLTSVMQADPGQRISVTGLPHWVPVDALDVVIDGIRDRFDTTSWSRSLSVSPAEPWTKVWTIQGPGDSGKVEAGYVVAL